MRLGWRQFVSVFAMYVIALSTILSAVFAPVPASASSDPFSIICHNTASVDADQSQTGQPAKPSKACDHCTMCSATPASSDSVDNIPAGYLEPGRVLRVLLPADAACCKNVPPNPRLSRGPPHNA